MVLRAALILFAISSSAAHAYNIAYWERKVPQDGGKLRVEHVVLNESGKVWFEAFIENDFNSRKSGYFEDVGSARAAELKIQARTVQPTQFNSEEAAQSGVPVIQVPGVENASECAGEQPFKVVQGRGLGPVFAACEQAKFYLEDVPAAQTLYSLMKALLNKAESKGLVGIEL
jgi:hypothetical protein